MKTIRINPEQCRLCYACTGICPSNAIEIKEKYAEIINDRCISCGSCLNICPHYAIEDIDSKKQINELLHSGYKVAAICAPSISGEFSDITDYTNFVGMIKALGFKYVCEVSFGADLIALKYRELFENFKGKYFITANCPAVVGYVERYHPALIDNMAPLISPMIATTQIVREMYGNDIKVVYIGPCVAAKDKESRYNQNRRVDAVLTFSELREMFKAAGVTENNVEFSDFDPPIGGKGSLFPVSRGMFQSVGINEDLLSGQLIAVDGKDNVIAALKEFENFSQLKQHLDLFYCDGNCIMGPGTSVGGQKYMRRSLVIAYTKKRLKSWDQRREEWEKNIGSFIALDYKRTYTNRHIELPMPSEEAITEVLKKIGRDGKNIQSGCQSCSFTSCRELAIAVSNGLANVDMCNTYVLHSKNLYKKRLRTTIEQLDQSRQSLVENERIARREKAAFQEASKITTGLLDRLPAGVITVDQDLKVLQSNKEFINILGNEAKEIADVVPGLIGADLKLLVPSQIFHYFSYVLETNANIQNKDIRIDGKLLNISVFTIKTNQIIGGIIRDMYLPEVQKDEIVNRVNEVINKNLKLVQEIAFLLGEGAADTEQMLNSVIESYKESKNIEQ